MKKLILCCFTLLFLFTTGLNNSAFADPSERDDDDIKIEAIDTFQSESLLTINVFGRGALDLQLAGPVIVERDPPAARTIQVEILSMDLSSVGPGAPVQVKIGRSFGLPPSTGKITPIAPRGPAFDSFFDVFFEVEVRGLTLRNLEPVRIDADLRNRRPIGIYRSDKPVLLYDERGRLTAEIIRSVHKISRPGGSTP